MEPETKAMSSLDTTSSLADHFSFSQVFREGALTLGLIAPLESYPNSPGPTMVDHAEMARLVDDAGFPVIWLRDVPFFDPTFGDVAQIFDPLVYAAYLASITQKVAIGTAGLLLPLRDPLIVAKQVASVDQLLEGRFLMGLASGDRPAEYPAFGIEYGERAERFRDAFALIQVTLEASWPRHESGYFGQLSGNLDLVPKPSASQVPAIVIGGAGQSMEWTSKHADGLISYIADPAKLPAITQEWRRLCGDHYKPYGYGTFFDLTRDPNVPAHSGRVLRGGRNALIDLWKRQRYQGVSHVALNFKPQQRPAREVIEELAEYVLPHFPAASIDR